MELDIERDEGGESVDLIGEGANKKRKSRAKAALAASGPMDPIVVHHLDSGSEGPPKRLIFKGTFNTHDIMHAPVEKTIQMLDKILAGERLFTM